MGTCGSLSVLKCYPKSQQWPIPIIVSTQPPPFSLPLSRNLRRRRLRTQVRLGINPGEKEKLEDIKDRFRRRQWRSDQDSKPPDLPPGLLDKFIDNSYILKTLNAYGWGLPIILLSLLAASGPKAFLMTMAFPVGEWAITFTFKKLSSMTRSSSAPPKRKTKTYKNKNKNKIRPQTKTVISEMEDEMVGKVEHGQNSSNFGGWD